MAAQRVGKGKPGTRLLGLVALLLVAMTGCGPQRFDPFESPQAALVWPAPPEQPRITYLGAVTGEADMERSRSWLEGVGELLFGKEPLGVLVSPYAVAVDSRGLMFVADSAGAAIHTFDLRTRDYRQFSSLLGDQKLQRPVGLAVADTRLYVIDSVLRQVCVFRKDGGFIGVFGRERLERPAGIAYRPSDGSLYVADAARHVIQVFDREGNFLHSMGSRGVGPGQFNFPTHLCVDLSGRLYVSDTLNYRVQVFAPDGQFLRLFGRQGDRPGNFAYPCGVAVDGFGNVYVSDRQFENVQVFGPGGQILMAFGQEGNDPGEFWLPAGVFVDSRNRIYVADCYNKRVQVFSLLEDTRND